MKLSTTNPTDAASSVVLSDVETTLRLVAQLPAPGGLEQRIQAALRTAPLKGRLLVWPSPLPARGWVHSAFARSAAAAIIVCVVAGGGWSVYQRVRPAELSHAVAMPQRVAAPGQFSSAGAMRTPQTENAPQAMPAVHQPPAGVEKRKTAKKNPRKAGVSAPVQGITAR